VTRDHQFQRVAPQRSAYGGVISPCCVAKKTDRAAIICRADIASHGIPRTCLPDQSPHRAWTGRSPFGEFVIYAGFKGPRSRICSAISENTDRLRGYLYLANLPNCPRVLEDNCNRMIRVIRPGKSTVDAMSRGASRGMIGGCVFLRSNRRI